MDQIFITTTIRLVCSEEKIQVMDKLHDIVGISAKATEKDVALYIACYESVTKE